MKMQELFIPAFLRDYALAKCKIWAEQMVASRFLVRKDEHYGVRHVDNFDQIAHVDCDSTGFVDTKLHHGDGLHEFLQFKECLKMGSQTVLTCYSTTISYLQRYFFLKYHCLNKSLRIEPIKN